MSIDREYIPQLIENAGRRQISHSLALPSFLVCFIHQKRAETFKRIAGLSHKSKSKKDTILNHQNTFHSILKIIEDAGRR